MRKWLYVIGLLLTALPAWAEQSAMPTKPHEIAGVIHATAPYGSGTFSFVVVSVYDASLWTDAPNWSMQSPFALSLRYNIDIDGDQFVDGSLDEMNKEQILTAQETAAFRPLLTALLPAVKEGDRMTALYVPGKNLTFYHNGQLTGSTTDMAFAHRFLDIWMSPHTSAPDLRNHLLRLSAS